MSNVQFGVASVSNLASLSLLGAGFGEDRATGYKTVLDELVQQDVIAKRDFGVYLTEPGSLVGGKRHG